MKQDLIVEPANVMEPFGVIEPESSPPPMLDFRGHDGTSFALPYRDLSAIAFHPAEGITMEFREHRIVIRGRNLRPAYDYLLRNRITFLQEDDFDAASESDTFIDSIRVERWETSG